MKDLVWKYCLVLILLQCLSPAIAQSDLEYKTAQLLSTRITWVKQFEGHINGLHESTLCLAYDGINCKGYLIYDSSDTEYKLEGTLQDGNLVLLEKYKDQPSGYIDGQIKNDGIDLQWKSIDKSDSFHAHYTNKKENEKIVRAKVLVFEGTLDEQAVKMTVQTDGHVGSGNLIYSEQKAEKLFAQFENEGDIQIENLTSGYAIRLVNARENQFEANFILPGSSEASDLHLMHRSSLDVVHLAYLSHNTKIEISLPSLDDTFEVAINGMIAAWQSEISKYQNNKSENRYGNSARIWFDLHSYNEEYLSGMLYYNSNWNKEMKSKTFTYKRKGNEMISLAPFLRGSAKWESKVKEKMLASKQLNNISEENQYKKWIERVVLMEPILCEGGLEFLTESNPVFGQARTFLTWEALSPLIISPSKLNKLRKTK